MNYKNLLTELHQGLLIITLHRPDKLNALNQETMTELGHCIENVYANKEIRGVIITGSGEKAFVAGADIQEFLHMTPETGRGLAQKGQDLFLKIEQCPKPILAAVNGYAFGGGCELALACHLRVAADNAKFAQLEINLGIIPGYGGTQRLAQLVGKGKATEWMLTAEQIDAPTALQSGLVNYVTSLPELLPFCTRLMEKILSKPGVATAMILQALQVPFASKGGYEKEIDGFVQCVATKDFTEGVTAFLEKRKPVFTNE